MAMVRVANQAARDGRAGWGMTNEKNDKEELVVTLLCHLSF
jgi:hypothetical protein